MQSTAAARARALFAALDTRPPVLPAHLREAGAFRTAGSAAGPVTATIHVPDSTWGRYVHEVVPTRFGIRVLFGDASGTPQVAAATAAQMLRTFRAEAADVSGLSELEVRIANALADGGGRAAAASASPSPSRELPDDGAPNAEKRREIRPSARLILLEYGPDHALTVVNRGYPAPLLVAHSRTRVLEPPLHTPAIGVLALGSVRAPTLTVAAFPGDRILLQSAPRHSEGRPAPFTVTSESTSVPVGGGAWCLVEFGADEPVAAPGTVRRHHRGRHQNRPEPRSANPHNQGRWIHVAG